jgi:PIN like domain
LKAQLDENLSPALARALHCLAQADEHEVIHVTDLVPRGTPDVDLFAAVLGAKIQIHITQDHHHRRPIERDAIAAAGLIVFVLDKGWTSQPEFEKAARLIQWWPRIVEHAEAMSPPAVFRVPWKKIGKGKFEQVRISR